MAWIVENRRTAVVETPNQPYLNQEFKDALAKKFFPRYPTKRAVLLPALHEIQEAYGWVPPGAMLELAEFLQLAPAEVMDTATFYEEYWLKPKGKYLIQVCRSLACEVCDSRKLTDRMQERFNLEVGDTTPDGKFTLVELECLGACGTAPVALVNDALYENLTPESLDKIITDLPEDPHEMKDPTVTWDESHGNGHH